MQFSDIERVLRLQNQAYSLLLWINKQEWLDAATIEQLRFVDSCRAVLENRQGMFPPALRVEADEIEPLAHLLCAFFTTSFRVETKPHSTWNRRRDAYDTTTRPRLVAGAAKKSKAGREKTARSARHLVLMALEELALENDCDVTQAQCETLLVDEEVSRAAHLWTYAHELLRRSQFASQGGAVHLLWLELDKASRETLSAEQIWQARATLLQALQVLAAV